MTHRSSESGTVPLSLPSGDDVANGNAAPLGYKRAAILKAGFAVCGFVATFPWYAR